MPIRFTGSFEVNPNFLKTHRKTFNSAQRKSHQVSNIEHVFGTQDQFDSQFVANLLKLGLTKEQLLGIDKASDEPNVTYEPDTKKLWPLTTPDLSLLIKEAERAIKANSNQETASNKSQWPFGIDSIFMQLRDSFV